MKPVVRVEARRCEGCGARVLPHLQNEAEDGRWLCNRCYYGAKAVRRGRAGLVSGVRP